MIYVAYAGLVTLTIFNLFLFRENRSLVRQFRKHSDIARQRFEDAQELHSEAKELLAKARAMYKEVFTE